MYTGFHLPTFQNVMLTSRLMVGPGIYRRLRLRPKLRGNYYSSLLLKPLQLGYIEFELTQLMRPISTKVTTTFFVASAWHTSFLVKYNLLG